MDECLLNTGTTLICNFLQKQTNKQPNKQTNKQKIVYQTGTFHISCGDACRELKDMPINCACQIDLQLIVSRLNVLCTLRNTLWKYFYVYEIRCVKHFHWLVYLTCHIYREWPWWKVDYRFRSKWLLSYIPSHNSRYATGVSVTSRPVLLQGKVVLFEMRVFQTCYIAPKISESWQQL